MSHRVRIVFAVVLLCILSSRPSRAADRVWELGQTWTYDFTMAGVWFGDTKLPSIK